MKRGRLRKRGLGVFVAALGCVVAGSTLALGVGLAQVEGEEGVVPPSVRVDGLDLGGKTRTEAARALHDLAERKLLTPIRFYSGRLTLKTNARALSGRCDTAGTLETAFLTGQSESFLERVQDRIRSASMGTDLAMPVQFDVEELPRRLRRLARRVERPPVEPRAREVAGKIAATTGRSGRLLDLMVMEARLQDALTGERWLKEIAASVAEGVPFERWAAKARPLEMNLAVRAASPRVTPERVREVQAKLASFITSFSRRDRNRVHNIRLAARAIDGLFLLPGDEFSYNETVGPRDARVGFRTAPQIVRGELVPGIGGGVCQVSSTLYNAALLADLEVTRRQHHRFPVAYVAAGRDATVSDAGLDLRFRNRLDAPVALLVSVSGGQITTRIYGAERCKRSVRLITARLRPAYTKRGGRRVSLVRVVSRDGEVVRRETISRDTYEPPPASARPKRRAGRRSRSG